MEDIRKKKGKPSDVDRSVGKQLRIRRVLLGMSQEQLSSAMGVTFQQIQKYERGLNRISAGSLHRLSNVLAIPIDYFYAEYNRTQGPDDDKNLQLYSNPLDDKEVLMLIKYFQSIEDKEMRQLVLDCAKKLSRASQK